MIPSVSGSCTGRLLLHHLLHPLLHFFCRGFRFVRFHHLVVAVWAHHRAAAIAPEHVHHRTLTGRAKLRRLVDQWLSEKQGFVGRRLLQ